MPIEQSIVFTAMPVEADHRNVLRVSVFVHPRLGTTGRLEQYPELMDWPQRINSATFELTLGGIAFRANPTAGQGKLKVESSADLTVWRDLLPGNTPVEKFELSAFENVQIASYPAARVTQQLETVYRRGAALAKASLATGSFAAIQAAGLGAAFVNGDPEATRRFREFHQRDAAHESFDVVTPPKVDVAEFHTRLSAYSQHPFILRKLGLAVDLTLFPSDDQMLAITGPSKTITLTRAAQATGVSFVAARVVLAKRGRVWSFSLAPRTVDAEVSDGLLLIGENAPSGAPRYDLVQLDMDGGGLKFLHYEADPHATLPPTLRTAGLSLVRRDAAQKLKASWDLAARRNAAFVALRNSAPAISAVAFDQDKDAEEFVRAFRVDVESEGRWHSLCALEGKYAIGYAADPNSIRNRDLSGRMREEGFVGVALTKLNKGGANTKDFRQHESMFRWDGWSLSAARPGSLPVEEPLRPDSDVRLLPMFGAQPGSLPKLRLGRTYRFRLRTVDPTGVGLSKEAADALLENDPALEKRVTKQITFQRAEIISSPLVAASKENMALVERLVLRTFFDPRGDRFSGSDQADFHVMPPRIGQMLAEQHGMFDRDFSDSYATIRRLDGPWSPDDNTDNRLRAAQGVPYLADPLARGAVFRLTDKLRGKMELKGSNLDRKPFLLALRALEQTKPAPEIKENAFGFYNTRQNVLLVRLRPAEVIEASLASYTLASDAGVHAFGREFARLNGEPGKGTDEVFNPMLAPARQMTVMHAVEAPLVAPVWNRLAPVNPAGSERPAEATSIALKGDLTFDLRSTGRLEVTAEWDERLGTGETELRSAHVYVHALDPRPADLKPYKVGADPETLNFNHEFGDTKHRSVRYRVSAVSRFVEHFPGSQASARGSKMLMPVAVPSSANPKSPVVQHVLPTFGWEDQKKVGKAFVHVRRGGGLRVSLDGDWYSSGDGEQLAVVLWKGDLPTDADVREEVGKRVSLFGTDPIWRANVARALLKPSDFVGGAPVSDLRIPNWVINGVAQPPVDIVAYKPPADSTKVVGFDLEMSTLDAYFPFVRLALARYQPNALPGKELSLPVPIEPIQLMPRREVRVVPEGNYLTITVVGPGHPDSENGQNRVVAWLEMRGSPGTPNTPSDLWEKKGDSVEFAPSTTGRLRVPAGWQAGLVRLVITEEEQLRGESKPGDTPRIVFSDIIELDR